MKIKLETIDGLPEGIASAVTEADGAHTLDLSGLMLKEDLSGLKSALSKERANVAAWAALGENPEAVSNTIEELKAAGRKGGKADEDHAALLQQLKDDHGEALGAKDAIIDKLQRGNALSELKVELGKAGVIDEGIDLLANFANSRIKFGDDGAVKVTTMDGKPMIGSGADHGATLSDLAKELAGTIPHLVKGGGAGGSGKQPGGSGKQPGQTTVTRSVWDSMTTHQRSAHVKDGGTVVDG